MTLHVMFSGLRIGNANHRESEATLPPTWPPGKDFPVVIDKAGNIVCRYGDPVWNLTPWGKKVQTLNFGVGRSKSEQSVVSAENAEVFKTLTAWWLYGAGGVKTIGTLDLRFTVFRPLFILCSKNNIKASDLARYPAVYKQLSKVIQPSQQKYFASLAHDIWINRDAIGFALLDPAGLEYFSAAMSKHIKLQTPYIPPRIWLYQVKRLKLFLDEFLAHAQKLQDCYNFAIDAYAHNAGSLESACQTPLANTRKPFQTGAPHLTGAKSGCVYYGAFKHQTSKFGIADLLERWLVNPAQLGPLALSSFFNLASHVAIAYIINFSLMRIDEAASLRAGCFESIYDDALLETISLIRGPTTKTIQDDRACWIVSASVKSAVDVLTIISQLRLRPAIANPDAPIDSTHSNPPLILRSYEPWRQRSEHISEPIDVRPSMYGYSVLIERYPKLFNKEKLRISSHDINDARLVNPFLDTQIYYEGGIWKFAWHQLRRTGAVNMTASGSVSEPSIQFELKHSHRAMSRYYGQGHQHVSFDVSREARTEYISTAYEMLARSFSLLQTDRYLSPHGEKRKKQILKIIEEKDHKGLVKAAQAGQVYYREIFLGGCTNGAACPYGGIDFVASCGGGQGKPACADLIIDKRKAPKIIEYKKIIEARLTLAPQNSPLQMSLIAQITALENALDVISNS